MSKLRVCILTTVHPVFDNRIFHKQARALVEGGYEVTIIARHHREEVVSGIRILPLPEPHSRFGRIVGLTARVLRLALKQVSDIYHFHDPELIPIGLILRTLGKTIIYDAHENVPDDISCKEWIPKFARMVLARWMDFAEKYAAKYFTAIVTADEQIATRFSGGKTKVVAIHNYPVLDEFASLPNRRGRLSSECVASFGGISAERSTRVLVRAMELLPQGCGVQLILGGSCDAPNLLEEVSQMPGWLRVQYRGRLSRPEMLETLSRCSAAIVMYSRAPNHFDIRSNRLYEAMAAGLPVITSNFPKWKAFMEDANCGLTVDPDDPQDLSRAVTYLYEHPAEAEQLGSRGRELAFRHFDWKREKEKLVTLYSGLPRQRQVGSVYRTPSSTDVLPSLLKTPASKVERSTMQEN